MYTNLILLKQKLEILRYAQEVNLEALASKKNGVSRATIYGWRNLDTQLVCKKKCYIIRENTAKKEQDDP